MARSDEAQWWFNAVYEAVQEIPYGQVTSYGHIARLLGKRELNQRHISLSRISAEHTCVNSGMPPVSYTINSGTFR